MTIAGLPLTMPTISNRSAAWPPLGMWPTATSKASGAGIRDARVLDLVDLDAEAGGQLSDRRAPCHPKNAGLQQHWRLIERPAETHHVEHHGRTVIGGVVGDLHAPDLLDALAGARDGERDQVIGEPGIDAGDEET